MLITFSAYFIDLNRYKLERVNAGHSPGYLIREKQVLTLKAEGLVLGADKDYEYKVFQTNVLKGDKLVLFTDALIEVDQNNSAQNFNVAKFILECSPETNFNEALINRIKNHFGVTEFKDDLVILSTDIKE